MTPSFSLLSRLWLHEPDEETLEAARRLDAFTGVVAVRAELESAYIDLFLLNVYPYGTAFTDPSGELNGRNAWEVARQFENAGYSPAELSEVGAPDHAGLCLGFLAHCAAREKRDRDFLWHFALWLPVCALAVERDSSAHPFYRALAHATREEVSTELAATPTPDCVPSLGEAEQAGPDSEVRLSDVIGFLLAPACCGFFLSRSRLARLGRAAGIALPFGPRFDLARTLFVAAGESGRAPRLLELLTEEASSWESAYRKLAREHPVWRPCAESWLERLAAAHRRIEQMRAALDSLGQLGYEKEGAGGDLLAPGPE